MRLETEIRELRTEMREEMPERLTSCMLERFEVNGAQPLIESRVQAMVDKSHDMLKEALLTEIRKININQRTPEPAESSTPAPSPYPAGEIIDGYAQWQWGGRFHMVPEGWCLPKGNVCNLFNLWIQGNLSMKIKPYRFLRTFDIVATEETDGKALPEGLDDAERKKHLHDISRAKQSYLSMAVAIFVSIEKECGMTMRELANLSAEAREAKFIEAFCKMCRLLHPDLSQEQLDQRRMHDKAHTTIYKLLQKKNMLRKTVGKRRKRTDLAAE